MTMTDADLAQRVVEWLHARGWTLTVGEIPDDDPVWRLAEKFGGNFVRGVTRWDARQVVIAADQTPNERLEAALHECGHVVCGRADAETARSHSQHEAEA